MTLQESNRTPIRTRKNHGYRISDALLLAYCCTQYVTLTTQTVNLWVCRLLFVLYVSVAIVNDVIPVERGHSKALSVVSVWCFCYLSLYFISSLWSPSLVLSLHRTTINDMLHVAILPFLLSYRITDQDSLYSVICLFVLLAIYVSVCLYIKTPKSDWGTQRVGMSIGTNPNTVGMLTSSSVFLLVFASNHYHNRLLLSLAIPLVYICMMTGSRKGMIFLILTAVSLPLFTRNVLKSFAALAVSVLLMFVLYYIIMNNGTIYALLGSRLNSLLNSQNTPDYSLIARAQFRRYALEHTPERPLFGHGLNAFMIQMFNNGYPFGAYSHCNYTELLYCYGIIGTLVYYCLYIHYFIVAAKKFLIGNTVASLPLLGIAGLLLLDYGMVSYLDVLHMMLTSIFFLSISMMFGYEAYNYDYSSGYIVSQNLYC